MTKYLPLIVFLTLGAAAIAQVPPDSVPNQVLDEVIVEAQMQRTSAAVTTYYPDKNSKRAAQNAIDLLNQMGIPQIEVNPIGGTVQTPSGETVAIYIDMEPATQEEKDALRPEDVKKVEYFVYPTDPRFNHEKYVINITLRRYDYGGYAKLSGTDNLLAGSGSGLVYGKMAYGRMTYDLSVSDKYTDRHHTGTEQRQVFRFPQADGGMDEITRSNVLDYSRFQQNQLGVSFRARYNTEKMSISNNVYFTARNTPRSNNAGQIMFSSGDFENSAYTNITHSSYLYPRWTGNYYFDLGRGFRMNAMPSVFYEHTRSSRRYATDETYILTDAEEDAITGQLQLQLNKTVNECHTFDVNLLGIYYYDKVKYSGSTVASPEFNQFAYGGILGYSFNRGNFYGQAVAGFAGESNKISGVRKNSFIPLFELNSQYAFNDRNSISLSAQYNINAVSAADKTPDMIQENELLYKQGNLHLKNTHWSRVTLDYTWLPNNKFSVAAFTGWSRYFNHIVPVYTPDGPGGLMLRSYENNGDYQDIYVGGTFTAKLLGGSLVAKVSPRIWFERVTGLYADTNNYLSLYLSATYYLGGFYFSGYYSPAQRMLVQYSSDATSSKSRSYYMLKVGWSNSRWNCSVAAINIFRGDWRESNKSLTSRWFDQYSTVYSANSHQFVSITASYTFGFGKKVKRGDEVQTMEGGNSAILK